MCGSHFTHEHHASRGNMHDDMRSAQISAAGTHSAIDIQNSIEPMLEQLNVMRQNCDMLHGDAREALFSAVEEARSLIGSIYATFEQVLPAEAKSPPAEQPVASA